MFLWKDKSDKLLIKSIEYAILNNINIEDLSIHKTYNQNIHKKQN